MLQGTLSSSFELTYRVMIHLRCCLIAWMLTAGAASARGQQIQKLDPSLDQIVPPNAALERIATGFNRWTEGPVWTREGSLLFAEIPANNIIRWMPGQAPKVFMHPRSPSEYSTVNG